MVVQNVCLIFAATKKQSINETKKTKTMTTFFQFNGTHYQTIFQDGNIYVDAKVLFKNVFTNSANYIFEISKNADTVSDGGRTPMWVPIPTMAQFFKQKAGVSRIENTPSFEWQEFQDVIFDHYYNQGQTQFISNKRIVTEAIEKEKIANENAALLLTLQEKLSKLETAESDRIALEREKAITSVNPIIRFLNNAWFPVAMSGIFALVIGGFSYEILSETMGLEPYLNVLLSIVWVMFPVLTAIRQYEFNFFDIKIQPLAVAMIVDMVFTAYHVGWLRTTPIVNEDGVERAELHWILSSVYVLIIPFMQKSTNDMIMKIRGSYLSKGWLPKN